MNIFRGSILFIIFSGFIAGVSAQKKLSDATLTYRISVKSDGKTDLAKSFEGATLTVYLKGNQSRTEMVNALGIEANVYDGRTGKGYILREYSGQKLMITLSRENWKQKNLFYHTTKFNLGAPETVTSGFRTKKATGLLPDGNNFSILYSTEFASANADYNNAFSNLPGIPVEYEITSGNLKFMYTLTNVSEEIVPGSKFELPRSGYRIMTYEENQQLKKGENK